LDDADWHGEGDTPDDLSGLIVVRDLRDWVLVLPWKLQGLVHPWPREAFPPRDQEITRKDSRSALAIATTSQR
jgi:hypothetical protein